jgi:hypothetical protein
LDSLATKGLAAYLIATDFGLRAYVDPTDGRSASCWSFSRRLESSRSKPASSPRSTADYGYCGFSSAFLSSAAMSAYSGVSVLVSCLSAGVLIKEPPL